MVMVTTVGVGSSSYTNEGPGNCPGLFLFQLCRVVLFAGSNNFQKLSDYGPIRKHVSKETKYEPISVKSTRSLRRASFQSHIADSANSN